MHKRSKRSIDPFRVNALFSYPPKMSEIQGFSDVFREGGTEIGNWLEKVWHDGLIYKFKQRGIQDKLLFLLMNF